VLEACGELLAFSWKISAMRGCSAVSGGSASEVVNTAFRPSSITPLHQPSTVGNIRLTLAPCRRDTMEGDALMRVRVPALVTIGALTLVSIG
jgi:hypothetical protein